MVVPAHFGTRAVVTSRTRDLGHQLLLQPLQRLNPLVELLVGLGRHDVGVGDGLQTLLGLTQLSPKVSIVLLQRLHLVVHLSQELSNRNISNIITAHYLVPITHLSLLLQRHVGAVHLEDLLLLQLLPLQIGDLQQQ